MISRYFDLNSHQTNIQQEAIGGITTFLTMAYIIIVNPSVLSQTGMDQSALVVITCLVAGISTILMGLVPKVPIAMAPGMGLNAFFAYTIVLGDGISWQVALGMVFWAGVLFLIMSLFGAREKIVAAIPKSLVTAISVGIGLFILFIGMKNMGLIIDHPATLVSLGAFSTEVLIGLAALFLTIILFLRKVNAAILIGVIFATALGFAFGLVQLPEQGMAFNLDISPIVFQLDIMGALKWSFLGTIFALFYTDLFDTIGTLMACTKEAGLVQKNGQIKNLNKMLGVDAFATTISGILGTSPTTSYIESGTGIAAGGRTGLTAVITGILFLLAIVFTPLIALVPAYATAPALIMVGFMMIRQIATIPWDDYEELIPAILTFILMPLTFSISTGLACGFVSWVLIKLLMGKWSEVNIVMYIVAALSLASLLI
jgi:AGZA family xanthine/uracil permease-like MFS transporter